MRYLVINEVKRANFEPFVEVYKIFKDPEEAIKEYEKAAGIKSGMKPEDLSLGMMLTYQERYPISLLPLEEK